LWCWTGLSGAKGRPIDPSRVRSYQKKILPENLMNHNDLIKKIASRLDLTIDETRNLYNAFTEEITDYLSKGEALNIRGFGTFQGKKRESRKGFNPALRKWMMLPPAIRPHFKSGETLKKRVNS
jgi:DNA-binding protein HU-beta